MEYIILGVMLCLPVCVTVLIIKTIKWIVGRIENLVKSPRIVFKKRLIPSPSDAQLFSTLDSIYSIVWRNKSRTVVTPLGAMTKVSIPAHVSRRINSVFEELLQRGYDAKELFEKYGCVTSFD